MAQLFVFVFSLLVPQSAVRSDYWGDLDNDGIPEQHGDDDGLDSDSDGLKDGFELYVSFTDPLNWDSDDDGFADGDEYHQNYGINYWFSTAMNVQSAVTFADIDGDGIPNWLDSLPVDGLNGMGDRDGDGIWDMLDAYPDDWWNNQPHFTYNGTEYAGSWSDSDSDNIPDAADAYPNDASNGYLSLYWSTNTYVNGQFSFLSSYYSPWDSTSDADSDGIWDQFDPYPNDASNNTAWFSQGQRLIDGAYQWFNGEFYYAPNGGDSDGDGLPDAIDPYVSDASNNTCWWNGGDFWLNGSYLHLGGYFSGYVDFQAALQSDWDSDMDGIMNVFDPYPYDPANNTSYIGGQYYAGYAFDGQGSPATTAWLNEWFNHPENRVSAPLYLSRTDLVDTDGDLIPDELEDFFGLNKNDGLDAWMKAVGSDYTYQERYLGWQDLRDGNDPWQYGQMDGIPNVWKVRYGYSLEDPGLWWRDTDEDGLDTITEYMLGTNPRLADTDEDGESDGAEVGQGSNPNDGTSNSDTVGPPVDTDGDGISDADEVALGTKPDVRDSDGGGVDDNIELLQGTDPINPSDDHIAQTTEHLKITNVNMATGVVTLKSEGLPDSTTNVSVFVIFAEGENGDPVGGVTMNPTDDKTVPFDPSTFTRWPIRFEARYTPVSQSDPVIVKYDIGAPSVDVKQPANVEHPGDPVATNKLRLCRWLTPRNSFNQQVETRITFPDNDPDRILIGLNLLGVNTDSVTLHIKTTGGPAGYNDSGADMVFKQDPPNSGHFVSEPIVLVTGFDDDKLPIGPNQVQDGEVGDRSFIAYAGGKIVVEGSTLSQSAEFNIEKPLKELTPIFIILDPTTEGSATEDALTLIPSQLMRMQQIYATLQIKVNSGNWLIMNRSQLVQTNPDGTTDESILNLLSNPDTQLTSSNLDSSLGPFLLSKWMSAFTQNAGAGVTLPEKPAVIVLLPTKLAGGAIGSTRLTVGMSFISVSDVILGGGQRAATVPHEVGHLLDIDANHGTVNFVPLDYYHLMNHGAVRNGIDQSNPDSSGKHFRFKDGNDARTRGDAFLTNPSPP